MCVAVCVRVVSVFVYFLAGQKRQFLWLANCFVAVVVIVVAGRRGERRLH